MPGLCPLVTDLCPLKQGGQSKKGILLRFMHRGAPLIHKSAEA